MPRPSATSKFPILGTTSILAPSPGRARGLARQHTSACAGLWQRHHVHPPSCRQARRCHSMRLKPSHAPQRRLSVWVQATVFAARWPSMATSTRSRCPSTTWSRGWRSPSPLPTQSTTSGSILGPTSTHLMCTSAWAHRPPRYRLMRRAAHCAGQAPMARYILTTQSGARGRGAVSTSPSSHANRR